MKQAEIHLVAAARPNFMKVAPLYHAMKQVPDMAPLLVHTGQHYDADMSDTFLSDLGLPEPDFHLSVRRRLAGYDIDFSRTDIWSTISFSQSIDQTSSSDRGHEGRFRPHRRIKTTRVLPQVDKNFLSSVFRVGTIAGQLQRDAPHQSAVLFDARIHSHSIT